MFIKTGYLNFNTVFQSLFCTLYLHTYYYRKARLFLYLFHLTLPYARPNLTLKRPTEWTALRRAYQPYQARSPVLQTPSIYLPRLVQCSNPPSSMVYGILEFTGVSGDYNGSVTTQERLQEVVDTLRRVGWNFKQFLQAWVRERAGSQDILLEYPKA